MTNTADDLRQLAGILDADDEATVARRVTDYYRDGARSDRTPRMFLYLHLGLLAAMVLRLQRDLDVLRRGDAQRMLDEAQRAVAAGAGHECSEWTDGPEPGRCQVCGRTLGGL